MGQKNQLWWDIPAGEDSRPLVRRADPDDGVRADNQSAADGGDDE